MNLLPAVDEYDPQICVCGHSEHVHVSCTGECAPGGCHCQRFTPLDGADVQEGKR